MEHHMMTKFHLNDFVHGMAVNARRTGLSISRNYRSTKIFLHKHVVLARCVSEHEYPKVIYRDPG